MGAGHLQGVTIHEGLPVYSPHSWQFCWNNEGNSSTTKHLEEWEKGRKGNQHAKKVVYDSPGLVDFAIGLVFFVLDLPDRQVLFFGEIQITEGLLSILPIKKGFGASSNDLWASTCYLQLARMAGCKTDFLCTLRKCFPLLSSFLLSPSIPLACNARF